MKIFPAIDIKDKKCVRLVKGDFDKKTEYELSPIEQAGKFKDHGFKNLHIVDLDGALTGETVNLDIIQDIVGKFNLKIEVGGGIRSIDSIKKYNCGNVRSLQDFYDFIGIDIRTKTVGKPKIEFFSLDREISLTECI